MAHLFIKDIQPGQQLNDTYMVTQPVLRNTTRGDLYIAMFLSDKTGKVNSRMWQATEDLYQAIPSEGFLTIRGKGDVVEIEVEGGRMLAVLDPNRFIADGEKYRRDVRAGQNDPSCH